MSAMTQQVQLWLVGMVAGYMAGAIPFGLLIGRLHGIDIRQQGSGNVGATNCGRVLGRKWGILCFLCDLAKGLLPVFIYGQWVGLTALSVAEHDADQSLLPLLGWLSVAVAAVIGHMFPLWLRFKGGKGVATGLGVLLGFWPVLTVAGLIGGIIWLITVKKTGYVSLGSILAALALPLLAAGAAVYFARPMDNLLVYVAICAALAGLVILRHRSNITRLRQGTESKVSWAIRGP